MKLTLATLAIALTIVPAAAQTWCSPNDGTSRILQSASPNDVHPQWSGGSFIGTAWSLEVKQRTTSSGVDYIMGDLYSPRNNLVNEGVYVIAREWQCG